MRITRAVRLIGCVVFLANCGGPTLTEPRRASVAEPARAAVTTARGPVPFALLELEVNMLELRAATTLANLPRGEEGRSCLGLVDGLERITAAVDATSGAHSLLDLALFDASLLDYAIRVARDTSGPRFDLEACLRAVTGTSSARVLDPAEQKIAEAGSPSHALSELVRTRTPLDRGGIVAIKLGPAGVRLLGDLVALTTLFSNEEADALKRAESLELVWKRWSVEVQVLPADADDAASIAASLEATRNAISDRAPLWIQQNEWLSRRIGFSGASETLNRFRNLKITPSHDTVTGFLAIDTITLGGFIDAMRPGLGKFLPRTTTREAYTDIEDLSTELVTWSHRAGRTVPILSAPLTPAEVPSGAVRDAPRTWTGTWETLDFEMIGPHHYAYEIVVQGSTVTVRARGDVDADGIESSFERTGNRDPRTGIITFGNITATNEYE